MKLSKRNVALIIALCLTFSLAFSFLFTKAIEQSSSAVNIPKLMNYQGRLTENGNPITGSVTVTFSIYDVPTGGALLWTETQKVIVTDGVFNALLGSTNPLTPAVFSSGETYLGIQVEGDGEIQPRQRLVSVAYALFAQDANTVGGQTPSEILASHTQDVPHMIFISSEQVFKTTEPSMSITVPPETQIAIINLSATEQSLQTAGQVTLTKDGCMSATLRDMTISGYTFTQVSWSENTITITVKAIPSGVDLPAGATAYFYR